MRALNDDWFNIWPGQTLSINQCQFFNSRGSSNIHCFKSVRFAWVYSSISVLHSSTSLTISGRAVFNVCEASNHTVNHLLSPCVQTEELCVGEKYFQVQVHLLTSASKSDRVLHECVVIIRGGNSELGQLCLILGSPAAVPIAEAVTLDMQEQTLHTIDTNRNI